MATVLIVEDEASLVATIAYNLRRNGYEVVTASDGEAALAVAAQTPDLVLLDLMLPKIDGLEVCRRLRERSGVPIIMLTARGDEVDRVVGLELGADDYLTKPFSMRELMARVKALLRRRELVEADLARRVASMNVPVLRADDLEIDIAGHRASRAGLPLHLTPKEFDLLALLVRHRGQVFSAERVFESVWGYEATGDTRTVAVHIRSLREKVEEQPSQPTLIETVRGVGYRFAG